MTITNGNSIGKWTSILYRYSQIYIDKELKSYNIGPGQFPFLILLLNSNGITTQDRLSKCLNIDKATTTRALTKLEQAGYLTRKVNPKDKRARIVTVTEKAVKLKPILHQISERWTIKLTAGFSDWEKELIVTILEKLAGNAEHIIREELSLDEK